MDERSTPSPRTQAILSLIQGLLPAMTAILGGLWVVFTYLGNQRDAELAAAARAAEAASIRRLEAQRPFLEKQLALYFETAQVVGRLVALRPGKDSSGDSWRSAEARFWALYWSELSLVEDRTVEGAMRTFGDSLLAYTAVAQSGPQQDEARTTLRRAAYDPTHALRVSIAARWTSADP